MIVAMESHQKHLVETAYRFGLEVELLQEKWQLDAVRFSYQGKSIISLFGRVFSHLNYVADAIAENKVASKALMEELGLPVPASYYFTTEGLDSSIASAFLARYELCVVKPLKGTDGRGISMHLSELEMVKKHVNQHSSEYQEWLLEAQVTGRDLRIQYLDGQLIAACVREPCTVIGDGKNPIHYLIDQRNKLIKVQNPENFIDIDEQVNRRLLEEKISLNTILNDGQPFQVKDVANMAQGAHAVDVTDQVHPNYSLYVEKIAQCLNIKFFSLDVMTEDLTCDPQTHANILEFNAQPAWLHHTFSEQRQHDIPKLLLESFFGELDEKNSLAVNL